MFSLEGGFGDGRAGISSLGAGGGLADKAILLANGVVGGRGQLIQLLALVGALLVQLSVWQARG